VNDGVSHLVAGAKVDDVALGAVEVQLVAIVEQGRDESQDERG
jgi:hypothetical protein